MSPRPSYVQKHWDDVQEGEPLPAVTMDVTYTKIIHNVAATWDFFPGHHNPEYARWQGQKTIYAQTIFLNGFIDRAVTDWGGPETFIVRRKMSMKRSIYAGDTMTATGRIIRRYVDEEKGRLVDLEVLLSSQDGPCVPANVTVSLPSRKE